MKKKISKSLSIILFNILFITVVLIGSHCAVGKGQDSQATSEIDLTSFYKLKSLLTSAKDGDTVIIPEGRYNFIERIVVSSGITIKGAGIDKTIIYSYLKEESMAPIKISGKLGVPFRVTGITFQGTRFVREDTSNRSYLLDVDGTCRDFRIDHCGFYNSGGYGLFIAGYTYGVIDHCEFVNAANDAILIRDTGTVLPGDESWVRGGGFGSSNAVFIEDNNFLFKETGNAAVVGMYGARYVFRYNYVRSILFNGYQNPGHIDAHGNSQYGRGTYNVEVYNNVFVTDQSYACFHIRGGYGLIYNNTLTGNFRQPMWYADYNSFLYHVGYTNEDADESRTPYIARYYIENNLLVPDQVHGFYFWNNKLNNTVVSDGSPTLYLQFPYRGIENLTLIKNRDYFDEDYTASNPSYTPYTYPHPLVK